MSRATNDLSAVRMMMGPAVMYTASTGLTFLVAIVLMVSIDPYVNETSRHAHLILPPPSPLERSHYDIALSGLAVRNVAKYSPPVFTKPADARHDHESRRTASRTRRRSRSKSQWRRPSCDRAIRRQSGCIRSAVRRARF